MSFDINPPSNKPVIREAASMQNDGGGGNLGYFEGEERRQKERQPESIFGHENEVDSFNKEGEEDLKEEDFSISKFIAEIIFSIKEWFKNLFK